MIKHDIEFAIKTEKAYQEIKKGKCKTLPLEEFLKKLQNGNKSHLSLV